MAGRKTVIVYASPEQCRYCGAELAPYLADVRDRIYGVPGMWQLVQCRNAGCAVILLAHDLRAIDISSFYQQYSTHSMPVIAVSGIKKLYREALRFVQMRKLRYPGEVNVAAKVIGTLLGLIPYFRDTALARAYWLPHRAGGRLVEVGFGNGQGLAQLQELGWQVTGVEFDQHCVDSARMMGFAVKQGDFASGLFESESLDAVVACHTIEHVPDPLGFIRAAYAALKPGGRLMLSTPNGTSYGAIYMRQHWRGLEVPRHLSLHNPASLHAMARSAGFTDIGVLGTPHGGFIWQQSHELRNGKPVSSRQSLRTLPYNMLAAVINVLAPLKSDEIILRCVK